MPSRSLKIAVSMCQRSFGLGARMPSFGLCGCNRPRGRSHRRSLTIRAQVDGDAKTTPNRWAKIACRDVGTSCWLLAELSARTYCTSASENSSGRRGRPAPARGASAPDLAPRRSDGGGAWTTAAAVRPPAEAARPIHGRRGDREESGRTAVNAGRMVTRRSGGGGHAFSAWYVGDLWGAKS